MSYLKIERKIDITLSQQFALVVNSGISNQKNIFHGYWTKRFFSLWLWETFVVLTYSEWEFDIVVMVSVDGVRSSRNRIWDLDRNYWPRVIITTRVSSHVSTIHYITSGITACAIVSVSAMVALIVSNPRQWNSVVEKSIRCWSAQQQFRWTEMVLWLEYYPSLACCRPM